VQDCDVLVDMCHYLSGTAPSKVFAAFTMGHRELAALAQAARVRNLVLSHVTAQFDRPGMRERVIREVGETFQGNIYFGEDLMEIPFASPAASKLD
jgi:ribonuclease BN (tRNA processing enzyme)